MRFFLSLADRFRPKVCCAWLLTVATSAACTVTPARDLGPLQPQTPARLAAVDWAAAGDEAVAWLSAYLQVDTTNPPGNETRGAEFLKAILAKEGIDGEILEFAPGRGSLVARLAGSGAEKPLCLMSHIDVVTAESANWAPGRGPLSGAIADGYVWGRGALDMKGQGILELAAMVQLKRHKIPLKRDVVLLAVADEEVDNLGTRFLIDKHWARIGCSHLLNEGGIGIRDVVYPGQTVFGVSVAEKGLLWLKMTARGKAGHGSTQLPGRAPDRLLQALDKLRARQLVAAVHPSLYESLAAAGRHGGGATGYVLQRPWLVDTLAVGKLMEEPGSRAMLANTCSITGFSGMHQPNVVPSEVSAQLDCRLLPGLKPEALLQELQALVGDDQVSWQVLHQAQATESPTDDPLFLALARHVLVGRSDAVVGPLLSVGFTDSMYARQVGVRAYGFLPVAVTRQVAETMHGADERMPVVEFKRGIRVLYGALLDVAAE